MIDWLETIPNEKLRSDVKKNILVSGGCITSLFQGLPVNDYDVYIQDMDVLIRLAQHYYPGTTTTGVDKVLDGRKREDYLNNIQSSFEIDDNESEEAVRYKTLKLDQVKLNISSIGMKKS
jgi:hypothetical protein